MKPHSLSRRLVSTVLLIQLAAAICVSAFAFVYERHLHFRSFDILLLGRANSILGAVQDAEDAGDNLMLDGTEASLPIRDIFEVRDSSGKLLGRSRNWSGPTPSDLDSFAQQAASHAARHPEEEAAPTAVPGQTASTASLRLATLSDTFLTLPVNGHSFRLIRLQGTRIVDPGDKGGGIPRQVTIYYGSSVQPVWKAILRSAGVYALSSLLVLALTGIAIFWLLNRGLAPVRHLAHAAAQVSTTSWNFPAPDQARNTLELAPLVAAIENLLAGLKLAFVKQSRFVSDAAHELKTSAAVVKSSLQLLRMRPRTPQEYEAGLDRSLADFERLETLVAQMLTLARLEATAADSSALKTPPQYLPPDPTELNAQARSTLASLSPVAELKGLKVNLIASTPVFVPVDAELLHVVFENLVMNAIQHSPAHSQIDIVLATHHRHATIRITDHGDGIPPHDLPYIFERFRRADPSRSRSTGGTGLGLAIVKAIIDQYDGAIHITSAPGRGTEVNLQFPITEPPLHTQPVPSPSAVPQDNPQTVPPPS